MILDLNGAKRLEGYKPARRRGLDSASFAAIKQTAGTGGYGGFAASKFNRLTQDFLAASRSIDQDLFADNRRLRARARDLGINNPFARNFIFKCGQNIVGQSGVLLQANVLSSTGKDTEETRHINQRIQEEWERVTQSLDFSADGKHTWIDLQHLAVTNCAREGENITRKVVGTSFNPSGFALQVLDNDQLDDTMMTASADGGQTRMGVEIDDYARPRAYWLFNNHPNDIFPGSRERKRIPAEFVIHTARWERPGQTRGYTWLSAAILELNQYARYEEAVIVAARASAAKFATIQETVAEGWTGDEDDDGNDDNDDGTQYMSGDAGELLQLAPGQTLNFTDPRFPTNTHKDFTQTVLRNVCSGLLVQYPLLANDLEGVNFSSVRAGLVDERDMWRVMQRWFIDHFVRPVFRAWLNMAMLTVLRDITLTPVQMEQMEWHPRGWDWVDPQRDAQSSVLSLGNALTTHTAELAKKGLRFKHVIDQLVKEMDYAREKGINVGTDVAGDQAGKGVAADETASDDNNDDDADGKAAGSGKGGGKQDSGKGKGGGKA
jgi:lambda family phage portal protein